jgi:hypothetical protein
MVLTLLYRLPQEPLEAQAMLDAFGRSFASTFGRPLDAQAVDWNPEEGLHAHVFCRRLALRPTEQSVVRQLWPAGLVRVLSLRNSPDGHEDFEAFRSLVGGCGFWQHVPPVREV